MLMVIFGAGASYDSAPFRPLNKYPPRHGGLPNFYQYRPPLSKELFDDRPPFNEWLNRFRWRIGSVLLDLRNAPEVSSVEHELERLNEEAQTHPERHWQLAAVKFYLLYMIQGCEGEWANNPQIGATNYASLLGQIQTHRAGERLCLVTFNYDTMLEDAIQVVGIRIESLSDYIASDDCKIIKLHGSVNWAREVKTSIGDVGSRDVFSIANILIDKVTELDISSEYRMINDYWITMKDPKRVFFPALAIPFETKKNYECPSEHVEALERCILEVTKILIIGWRATESHFVSLLCEKLRANVQIMTVAENRDKATESNQRIQEAGIKGMYLASDFGFSDFLKHHEVAKFLLQ